MTGAEVALIVLSVAAIATSTTIAVKQSELQAELADRAAKQAKLNAAAEERRLRRQQAREMGAARAFIGASGTQMLGSPLDVLADQAMEAEENALLVRFGGMQRAAGFEAEGAFRRSEATAAMISGSLDMANSMLKGGVNAGVFDKKSNVPSTGTKTGEQ